MFVIMNSAVYLFYIFQKQAVSLDTTIVSPFIVYLFTDTGVWRV